MHLHLHYGDKYTEKGEEDGKRHYPRKGSWQVARCITAPIAYQDTRGVNKNFIPCFVFVYNCGINPNCEW